MRQREFERTKAMTAWRGHVGLGAAILALFVAGQAGAQENLDSGKTPAQLFASDCAICHKTPSGLSKQGNARGGLLGLQGFLREHYTASREAAAAIAAYVQAADRGPPPGDHKRAAKPKEKVKPGESQAAKPKANAEGKPDTKSEPKAPDTTATERKPADSKPAASAPAEPKAEAPKSEPKADSEKKSD
jgi:hypothetical protein